MSNKIDQRIAKKLKRTQAQLGLCVEAKDWYGASQLYHSLHTRLTGLKLYSRAYQVSLAGAHQLLAADEVTASAELGKCAVETFQFAELGLDKDAQVSAVVSFFEKFDYTDAKPGNVTAIEGFIKTALAQVGQHPGLHKVFAEFFQAQKRYKDAHRHYLRSQDPVTHARSTIAWVKHSGYFPAELDLFATRSVLQYLALTDMKNAQVYYRTILDTPLAEPLDSPLIHFVQFLLVTCTRDAKPLFTMLTHKYKTALSRDRDFKKYMDKIGEIYFGIPAPKGLLDSLFK